MKARKRFGQHFLEPVWIRKVVDVIGPSPGDVFLEIGAGQGALTYALAASGARVVAVEIDTDLVAKLRRNALPNVEIISGDFLTLDVISLLAERVPVRPSDPATAGRLVGNIPYNITSPVFDRLFALCRTGTPFRDAVLMLQRELAQRVVARPGSGQYGPLGILTRLYADAESVLTLPPGAFRPPPRVWSTVVRLAFRPPPVPVSDPGLFEALVRGLFTRRRKTLYNALRPVAGTLGHEPAEVLAQAGVDGRRRPEMLDLTELARLTEVLASHAGRAVL